MRRAPLAVALAAVLVACVADPGPSATAPVSPSATPITSLAPSTAPTAAVSENVAPSPSAEPAFSLPLPESRDDRVVAVSVAPEVDGEGGRITVTVTSAADTRIDELVLRWPTELDGPLFMAPFVPSEERIVDGGPPLVQPWTKWVIGPGEHDEPDGTTSLGYGPLLAGTTLEIPLYVTRTDPAPVAFDLQVLAGNDLLTLDGGEPAELRVEIP